MNFTMRNALLFAFIAACLGGVVAYVQYHKPHKDYAQATVEATWEAAELVQWYGAHDAPEHVVWQDKMVAVVGKLFRCKTTLYNIDPHTSYERILKPRFVTGF